MGACPESKRAPRVQGKTATGKNISEADDQVPGADLPALRGGERREDRTPDRLHGHPGAGADVPPDSGGGGRPARESRPWASRFPPGGNPATGGGLHGGPGAPPGSIGEPPHPAPSGAPARERVDGHLPAPPKGRRNTAADRRKGELSSPGWSKGLQQQPTGREGGAQCAQIASPLPDTAGRPAATVQDRHPNANRSGDRRPHGDVRGRRPFVSNCFPGRYQQRGVTSPPPAPC